MGTPESSEKKTKKLCEHIFVKPEVTTYPRAVKSGGGYPPTEVPHPEEEETAERRGKGIRALLQEVITETQSKALKDEMAYFVVDFRIKADHPATEALLNRIQSTLLAFLNEEKTKVLVASALEGLNDIVKSSSFPKSMEKIVFDIRGIRIDEQISKTILDDKEWQHEPKDVDVFVVPNIQIERIQNYINQAKEFLERNKVEIRNLTVDKFSKSRGTERPNGFPLHFKVVAQFVLFLQSC